MGIFLLHYLLFSCKRCMLQLSLWCFYRHCRKIFVWFCFYVIRIPQFQIVNRKSRYSKYSTDCQIFKGSLKFWCKYIMKLLYSVDVMFCLFFPFIYLQYNILYISIVHTLMLIAKLYLTICMYVHIVLVFEFLYTLFFNKTLFKKFLINFSVSLSMIFFSLKSCQWYAKSMILLYDDANNYVEENGGNVSLRILVFVGINNF